jgi:hypothetical protein
VRCDQAAAGNAAKAAATIAAVGNAGSVDRCEVGYAALRADGCTVRPVLIAVAVLPSDCDAFRSPCGGCCCD